MTKASRLLTHCVLMVAAAFTAQPTLSFGAKDTIAVVVSKSFPVDNLSFGDLKRLYMGNSVTAGGKTLIPLTYPKQAQDRAAFDQSVLGMSPDEVGRYWIDRKIRGQTGSPKTVESAEVVMKVVTKVEGAIGYVRHSAASQDVKTLRIDGKLPTDPGYRISD
jgi:ABC-type phosphate transport system substrate-binding protein